MKKKHIWMIAVGAVLLIACIVLAVLVSNFMRDGVHILGQYAHISFQKTCYFIEGDTLDNLSVSGSSTFTVNGYLHHTGKGDSTGKETSPFDGHMEVAAHPMSLEEGYKSHFGGILDKEILLTSHGIDMIRPDSRTYYTVNILRSNPDVVVIHIYTVGGATILAVCGESEENALSNYRTYMKEIYGK